MDMAAVKFTSVTNGDVTLNVAVMGDGPLILCIHGWPELWYSWRHQMTHFAALGYTVAAMDVRGYGGSSKPDDIAAYTLIELAGDAAAVIDQLGNGRAIVFGHDWGAPIAWNTARLHPNKVAAVAGLSVPYFPIGPDDSLDNWRKRYTEQDKFFYQVYFADRGDEAEEELIADSLRSIRMIYYSASGEGVGGFLGDKTASAPMLEGLVDPDPFPSWASPQDLQVYADAMQAGGWKGPLNRYRAQPLDAEQLGSQPDPNLSQPATFIGGELDMVRNFVEGIDTYSFAAMACDDYRGTTLIQGAGHWVQQEAPHAVNTALESFVKGL
jgi:pimeloyl-ACP methyl ester carboxylesterase